MHKALHVARRGLLYFAALILLAGHPTMVTATVQEQPTAETDPVSTLPSEVVVEEEEKPLTYTYNPETGRWDSEKWVFNPETGRYETPPAPVIIEPEPVEAIEKPSESVDKTVDTTVEVDNKVDAEAVSGDALVAGNTEAGSAISGDAEAIATIINSVNSSVSASDNQKVATFTKDIVGDVKGDIILYPLLLKAMLEEEAKNNPSAAINTTTHLDVNNEVNLGAKSGDATIDGNTVAGDATTGNATAMANVVNILNSLIAMQDSFIGTINIYGSLEGDILIAPDFIPQMLANNGGGDGSSTQLSAQDTTTIVNNISAVAKSGAADVFGNTEAGDATTGSADTNVVIFNVTGRDIVAENSMLVFVNVLGRWVGMIVDAPEGATAAMIGNGVTKNGHAPDLTVTAQSTHGITNTIAVTAESGDATVSHNTSAGDATSGNARALANVANVSGSQLSLTGWFGLLFINVMGDWFGSFQVDTPFGNFEEVSQPDTPAPAGPVQFVPREQPRQVRSAVQRSTIIDSRFTPQVAAVQFAEDTEEEPVAEKTPQVMGASDSTQETDPVHVDSPNYLIWIVTGGAIFAGVSIAWVRRMF